VDLGRAPDGLPAADLDTRDRAAATEWSWPPEAPWHPAEGSRFTTEQWAPPSMVRHPWLRVGRWTLLYRR
jgi:hypothetical protein